MLEREAQWLRDAILDLPDEPGCSVLNFGSQNAGYLRKYPYIDQCINTPTMARGWQMTNLDLLPGPGVDISGNLYNDDFLREVKARRFRGVYLFNVLEHVTNVFSLCERIESVVDKGGWILVSVPRNYPPHEDPIDNGFRPATAELQGMFTRSTCLMAAIVDDFPYTHYLRADPARAAKFVARLGTPFYRPRRWLHQWSFVPHLVKPFSVTCALFRRDAD
jgi:hypothetical protein